MTKKSEAMPLSSLFVERKDDPVTLFDPAKGGVVVDLADTTMKRLKFELNLPTMDPNLRQAIEDDRDRCATELATRQLKASATNSESAKAKRKDVSREEIINFRDEYIFSHGHKRGWMKAFMRDYPQVRSRATINAYLKEN